MSLLTDVICDRMVEEVYYSNFNFDGATRIMDQVGFDHTYQSHLMAYDQLIDELSGTRRPQ